MPSKDLTDFIEQVTGESHLRVETDLGDGFVVLKVSEAERRQARHDVRSSEDIVIEMLRNARDAHAHNIFLAVSKEGSCRRMTMLDDGDGIPEHLVKRIFDARVTSKLDSMHIDTWGVHGRGMALYAVRLNAKKAFVATTKVDGGSAFVIETDTTQLPEKVDQSSMPVFSINESGTVVVRGTRNINRAVCEFAYVDRDNVSVYLGSPVEIAATLYEYGALLLPRSTRAFCSDIEEIEVCKRLALASNPEEFAQMAASLGLELSERSARRILDGEVSALAPLSESISVQSSSSAKPKARKRGAAEIAGLKDARSLKLTHDDVDMLTESVSQAFADIAERYYLNPNVEISMCVRKNGIHITIPVDKAK
ncbi:MAG: ATP-binding protein [Eggerthellaceae bacterium]|nr:ATP-binding protein [Eggerthellaceae bacterium]